MLTFELTPEIFVSIKDTLRLMLPDAGSARRVEAAARGLGFNTHAALRSRLSQGPALVTADAKAFAGFLAESLQRPGEAFMDACAVQVMIATVTRYPDIPMGDLARHLGTDARTWAHPRTRKAASLFLLVLERLRVPSFLKGMGNSVNTHQILMLARNDFYYPPDLSVTAAAALHAGLKHRDDRPWSDPVTFHRPRFQGPEMNPAYRHKEFGFAFECDCVPFGRHTRYGHGTLAEANRYAELLGASPDYTCNGHRTLSEKEWDVVRMDVRVFVFDLCSDVAEMEGRAYPGRPWSEERARVRDDYPLSLRGGQAGAGHAAS